MPLLTLLVLIGGPLLLTLIALGARSATRGHLNTSHEWRWVRATWGAAVLIGAVAAWLVSASLDLGRGTMLIPAILGLFVVVGVGLGETVVRPQRPTGARTASLTPRRVSDYLPNTLTIAVGATSVLHLATLSLTTVTASADDMGRDGRRIAAQCGDTASAAGSYPGTFYSIPLVLLLLVVAVAAAAALSAVVRRPRGFAPDEVSDDVLRRRSAARVVAATGAAVAASHMGIAFFAGTALLNMTCQHAWMDPVGWILIASIPVALVLLGWFMVRIVVPAPLPSPSSAQPVEAQ
ncbi:hypothetical protein [Nesterenkonia rhizosphaerae]|uniref:DUF1648 domain-containing protein n=1 Tax=Nesterenkonia rhizosphaerae TaxID=1348272 RepID=A0ABP9FRG0_9MICC